MQSRRNNKILPAIFAGLVVLLLIHSCIDLVSDDFIPVESIPVINSLLVNDSLIEVHLSEIGNLDSTSCPIIANAQITIFMNGIFVETIHNSDSGTYKSGITVEEKNKYSCIVNIPGKEELYCEDSVPASLDVEIYGHSFRAGLNEEGNYYRSINFSFHDDPATADYYEILIIKKFKNDFFREIGKDEFYPIAAYNESYDFLLNEGLEPYSTNSLVFSDQLISPELTGMTLNYGMGGMGTTVIDGVEYQTVDEHTIIVEVRRISKQYYNFKKRFFLYEKGRYGELIEGMVTPFQIYSNVENGKGIFAAYAVAVDSIHFEKERIPMK